MASMWSFLPPGIRGVFEGIGWQTLALAGSVIVAGWIVNLISNHMINRAVERRGGDEHAAKTARKVSAYLIYSLTFIVLLGVFGVPLSSIGAAVGLIGLGISFALKDLLANFISGMMILINRPFKIGDQIKVEGEEGTVRDIKVRATTIKTFDGRQLIVPNSTLYNSIVTNNTAYNKRRYEVVVGIGYDDDIEAAREAAMDVLENAEQTESNPEPQVLVNELGGSSVNLRLRGWTDTGRANVLTAASEVTEMIKNRYDEEGIDIPFPIRTVIMDGEE